MTSQPTSCLVVVLFGSNCSSGANDSKTKKQARRQGREEKKRATSDDRIGKNLQGSSASKHHAAKKKSWDGLGGRGWRRKKKRGKPSVLLLTLSLLLRQGLFAHTQTFLDGLLGQSLGIAGETIRAHVNGAQATNANLGFLYIFPRGVSVTFSGSLPQVIPLE